MKDLTKKTKLSSNLFCKCKDFFDKVINCFDTVDWPAYGHAEVLRTDFSSERIIESSANSANLSQRGFALNEAKRSKYQNEASTCLYHIPISRAQDVLPMEIK